jgi:hypothetical protein
VVAYFSGRLDARAITDHHPKASSAKKAPSVGFVAKIPDEAEHIHIIVSGDPQVLDRQDEARSYKGCAHVQSLAEAKVG